MSRIILLSLLLVSCSSVHAVYQQPGYDGHHNDAIKRIAVVGWASPAYPNLNEVLSRVTTDLIKLRKNYLVHSSGATPRSWTEMCAKLDGVLMVRALNVQAADGSINLTLAAELFRCTDGALAWRAEGEKRNRSRDEDLTNLTGSYHADLGAAADTYAAPAFALIQQLIESLPDPVLNDEDVTEKIELGAL